MAKTDADTCQLSQVENHKHEIDFANTKLIANIEHLKCRTREQIEIAKIKTMNRKGWYPSGFACETTNFDLGVGEIERLNSFR